MRKLLSTCLLYYLIILFAYTPNIYAISFNMPIESPTYSYLSEAEALGAIDSMIWGIKPFSEYEVMALTKEALSRQVLLTSYIEKRLLMEYSQYKDIIFCNSYLKPVENPYITYRYNDNQQYNIENNLGRDINRNNIACGFYSKWKINSYILWHSWLEFCKLWGDKSVKKCRFLDTYIKLGGQNLFLEFGEDSVLWGQGYTGTLLTSINPKPYRLLIKIGLDQPVLLPYLFRYLGLVQFVCFATRLNNNRYVPHPWLFGFKLSLKPLPNLEIGFSRTDMTGGKHRKISISNVLFATHENVYSPSSREGDQKAGVEIRFRPVRHLVLYWEGAGEDEAGGLPSKWSHILGLYYVGLLNKINFRLEYTYIGRAWYHHHIYKSGYTYYDNIIGYYTGRESHIYFSELSYDIDKDTRVCEKFWYEKYSFLHQTNHKYETDIIKYLDIKNIPAQLLISYQYSSLNKYLFTKLKIFF